MCGGRDENVVEVNIAADLAKIRNECRHCSILITVTAAVEVTLLERIADVPCQLTTFKPRKPVAAAGANPLSDGKADQEGQG
jgi:hypothetical protein